MLSAALLGCSRPPAPVPMPRYVVGEPYMLGGVWSYPREDFSLVETGVAEVLADGRAGRRTANGEVWDGGALLAVHRTLQLPAIVTVTNLENGRAVRVRVNDRGPARAGRVIGLSGRAGALLGVPAGGAARVALAVEAAGSAALARGVPGAAAAVAVAAAPRGEVVAESLAPLPGARESARVVAGGSRASPPGVTEAAVELPGLRLPETVSQGAVAPGRLVVEAGVFFRRELAQRQAARLAGLAAGVEAVGSGRQPQYRVRLGPYDDLAVADAAVAGVLAAGVPEVRLLVE